MATPPVLTVLHPADLFRQPSEIPPSNADWSHVAQYLAGRWPQEIPEGLLWGEAMDHANGPVEWLHAALSADYIVVDTEYYIQTRGLTLLGLYAPGAGCLQIPWLRDQSYALSSAQRASVQVFLEELVSRYRGRWVAQNWLGADWPVLHDTFGIAWPWERLDDTMLLHSVLHGELGHDL